MARVHFRTCNLCEAMCGLAITVDGNRITDLRGDPDDPFSRGHVCPKALGLKDVHEDPDRLRRPLKREGGQWIEISWDRAFEEVVDRLRAVRRAHGRSAVAVYQGNPTVHNYGSVLYGQLLARALRTPNNFSATSLDQLPAMLAALEMFGHQLLLPIPDLDRTQYFLVLGANPLASNGSLMTAGDVKSRLRGIQARGGRIVVVDPRRSETAELADRHVFIRPGTDVFFLAALVNAVLEQMGGTPRLGRLADFTDGVQVVQDALRAFTAESSAKTTGVPAAIIREIAAEMVGASAAVAYGRVGVSTQEFGGLCAWLVNVLNIVTGNLDRAGGAMFTKPAVDMVQVANRIGLRGSFARRRSRVRKLPEFGGELPAAVLAEEIDTPGEGQIRALITSAGNPVLSAPNGPRLERALPALELMVSIDIYLNETTRHAHYILPPTFALEHSHYDLAFHLLSVRNTAKFGEAIFERADDQRHDWEIFTELALRLKAESTIDKLLLPVKRQAMLALTPERALAMLLELGPWGAKLRPRREGLTLGKLRASPHGIDLGPLEPSLPERLVSSPQRIHLAPALYLGDLRRAAERLSAPRDGEMLSLIGRRQLRSNNSWMHNSERLVKGRNPCTLLMHPDDAQARGLASGARVQLRSASGAVEVELEISDEMMPGVVSLPHGFGHHRPGVRLRTAAAHAGASINDVTLETAVDVLTGTVSFSGVPVTVVSTAAAS